VPKKVSLIEKEKVAPGLQLNEKNLGFSKAKLAENL
jgi:hypothetical protein